jgi:carboxymethylenebutenolidase
MKKLSFCIVFMMFVAFLRADEPSKQIPPDADGAMKALQSSTRHGEWVDIPIEGGTKLHAWVVHPERKDKAPVVIVIHEIFGMTDWVRAVADQLAGDGFVAIAPDMLSGKGPGGGNSDSFKGDEVRSAIQKLKPEEVATMLDASRAYAIALPNATDKTATIGFCWGGGQSFAYATRQPQLTAAVVYYGAPPDKSAMEKISAPVLGCYGGEDARITKTVEPTKKQMSELNKSYAAMVFDGAGHGFLRQQTAKAENAKAANEAWPETIKFLKKNLEDKP